MAWILEKEVISYTLDDIKTIVNQYYPDLRKCINTVQLNSKDSTLKLDNSILVSSNYIDKVIDELKKSKPYFNSIRQIIADSNIEDFDELFKALYERASEFLPNKEGTVAMLVNDHQYKANFRIDKEINTMSLIQNLINNK